VSTDPADMLGPTVTVTPAGQTTPTAGEDLLRQCADAYRAIPGPIDLNQTRLRAVVDEAVRHAEQRNRYDLREAQRDVTRVEEQRDQAWATIRALTADLDAAHADAAQLRAAAGPAQDWASAADLQAAYTDLLRRLEVTEVDIATLTDQLRRTEAECDDIEAWGLAQVDDLNGRLHRAERERAALAHGGTAPESGPRTPLSAEQASGGDRSGVAAQGRSGGLRASLPERYADDPIGRQLLDLPHEYRQHDDLDIPVCVCGWGWGNDLHGGPEREITSTTIQNTTEEL
jgi:hypothetical protein